MTYRDVIGDSMLDARDNGNGFFTATCPVCMEMGMLAIDARKNTFRCTNPACRVSGDMYALDKMVKKRRGDWRMHEYGKIPVPDKPRKKTNE